MDGYPGVGGANENLYQPRPRTTWMMMIVFKNKPLNLFAEKVPQR